ncbi:MAG: transglutaminase domain-containing protein [Evtepia sp.]|uniref:transglutaminase domain-containing protein n=1 Tax=Evtepia sp. TaxID=2773933 RepID=UPI002A76493A|nr:transglutaminase domain-containing protein [Evtepia sp.]MDY3014954.1 transglutaminase domain-containing protein [Evtepia sp.]
MRLRRPLLLLFCLVLVLLSGCSGVSKLASQVAVSAPPEDYISLDDGFRYTKSTLSPQVQSIYDQILMGIKTHEEKITGLYPDTDMIQTAVQAIERDYPELFWFAGTGQIETTLLGETPLEATYLPSYLMDKQEQDRLQQQVDHWTAACLASIPQNTPDYEKILAVYEYIIENTDYQPVERNSMINVMVNGAGMCGCYAKTTQYLLNLLGIDCAYISGTANGESHAWNLVWVDGTPCWLDTTWGDPVFEGRTANDGPSYDYFCITTSDLLSTHTIDSTVPVPYCGVNGYNYYRYYDLYFETFDREKLVSTLKRAIATNERQVHLRFDRSVYPTVTHALFSEGEIYSLFQRAEADLQIRLSLNQSIWYSRNDAMGTISITIPY